MTQTSIPLRAVGSVYNPGPGNRRRRSIFFNNEIRAGGQGTRRAGSYGRHVLPQGHNQAGRGNSKSPCLRPFHRDRRLRRKRGADNPDRKLFRIHGQSDTEAPIVADGYADCRGRGRGYRGDIQYPGRRNIVRGRASDARGERKDAHTRRNKHCNRDLYRPAFFGTHPSFVIPAIEIRFFQLQEPAQLLLYVVLGGIIGVASAVFIKSIYWTEHLFDRIVKKNYYVRHMLGMFLVGVIFYLLKAGYGHYYVEGVGYAAIQDILSGALTGAGNPPSTVRAETRRHIAYARLRRFGRHLLPVPFPWRDHRPVLWNFT